MTDPMDRLTSDNSLTINCHPMDAEGGWAYSFDGAAMRIHVELSDVDGTPFALFELFPVGKAGEPLPEPSYSTPMPATPPAREA